MTNPDNESTMRTLLAPSADQMSAAASKMVSDAHRAMLAHDGQIKRLSEDVQALEEVLAHKKAALDAARGDRDSFHNMVRETFDFYRSVVSE